MQSPRAALIVERLTLFLKSGKYANASFFVFLLLRCVGRDSQLYIRYIGTRYTSSSRTLGLREEPLFEEEALSTKKQNCLTTRFSKTRPNLRTSICCAKIISTIERMFRR